MHKVPRLTGYMEGGKGVFMELSVALTHAGFTHGHGGVRVMGNVEGLGKKLGLKGVLTACGAASVGA